MVLFSRRVLTTGREVPAGGSDGLPTIECGWAFVLRPIVGGVGRRECKDTGAQTADRPRGDLEDVDLTVGGDAALGVDRPVMEAERRGGTRDRRDDARLLAGRKP